MFFWFAVMTNNLLRDWHLRIKFVDDTTALEILPRNGISLLNVAVNDIHKFSIEHNMKLNPKKCKEMLINFIQNDSSQSLPHDNKQAFYYQNKKEKLNLTI